MNWASPKVRFGVLAATVLVIILVAAGAGGAPIGTVVEKMLLSPFQSPASMSKTLERFTPLLLAGIAVFWALRAGLFNIGVEGQFMVGGLAASVVALRVPGPGGTVLALLAGVLIGGAWAFPAAWLKAYRGAHEVISTIMLNNIAAIFCASLIAGPLMAPGGSFPATQTLPPEARFPGIQNGALLISFALVFAFLGLFLFARWLNLSVGGFELSAVGMNRRAAEFAGIEAKRVTLRSMVASGAIAGFAGALQLLAHSYRFDSGFSSGYGFDALGVALLAGATPWGLIPGALAFAILNVGATQVQFLGVPKGLTTIILAVLIVLFAALKMVRREAAHA